MQTLLFWPLFTHYPPTVSLENLCVWFALPALPFPPPTKPLPSKCNASKFYRRSSSSILSVCTCTSISVRRLKKLRNTHCHTHTTMWNKRQYWGYAKHICSLGRFLSLTSAKRKKVKWTWQNYSQLQTRFSSLKIWTVLKKLKMKLSRREIISLVIGQDPNRDNKRENLFWI